MRTVVCLHGKFERTLWSAGLQVDPTGFRLCRWVAMLADMSEPDTPSQSTISDEELAEIVQRGGAPAAAAFTELRERHNWKVVIRAAEFDESNKEDLAQDVWIKVWCEIHSFHGGKFSAWLFTLVNTRCIDAWRRSKVRRTQPIDSINEPSGDGRADLLVILRERALVLCECIAKLPDRQQCIVWATLRQMKTAAAAKHCGVSSEQAAVAKHRAIGSLRECTARKGV